MIKPSDYFITPGDIARFFRWRYLAGVTVSVVVGFGITAMGAGWDVALFVGSIIATIIWKMDARIPFGIAIVCFIAIMIATVVGPQGANTQGGLREQLAVAAFYCLVVGVTLLIREHASVRTAHYADAPQALALQPVSEPSGAGYSYAPPRDNAPIVVGPYKNETEDWGTPRPKAVTGLPTQRASSRSGHLIGDIIRPTAQPKKERYIPPPSRRRLVQL